MTSSLARSKQIIGAHFYSFSAIFLSFGVPQYSNRLDYIKACNQQFTLTPKNHCISPLRFACEINKSSPVAEMGDHLATIGMGRNWRGAAVGAGSPSNTMWPGPRPTSLPSGILINPTVWPQL